MRITRNRNEIEYHCNPEKRARALWKETQTMRRYYSDHYEIRKAEAYRQTINELFGSNSTEFGAYPLIFVTDNGDCLCNVCAKKVFLDERTDVTSDIYYEGPIMYCDECNREIESAYGDPGENEE